MRSGMRRFFSGYNSQDFDFSGDKSNLRNAEVDDIIQRDDHESMMRWIKHHLDGDWFTSRLLRFIAQCDENNLNRMTTAYPSECSLWYWYKTGENPRQRELRHIKQDGNETVVGEIR